MSQVQSLERAFILLKLIALSPNGLTMTKLAQQAKLPTSTVSRLLQTLERFGAVERVATREGFRIGPGIFALASQGSFSQYIISIARPHLSELAKTLGETVTLSLPDGDQTHCIDQILGQHHLQTQNWIDQSYPLHATSDGKICLAYWPGDRLDRYLKQALSQLTAATITDVQDLRQELARAREAGYAWSYEEYEAGIVDVAAPIRYSAGHVVATVGVSGPAFRFPLKEQEDEVGRLVVEVANRISKQLAKTGTEYPLS